MKSNHRIDDLERKINELTTGLAKLEQINAEKEIEIGKVIEAYSHNYSAWLNSDLERDKSILTLSVAGLGLLLSLVQSTTEKNIYFIMFMIANAIGFLISTWAIISIFKENKDLIKSILRNEPDWQRSHIVHGLKYLDNLAYYSFTTSILMSFLIIVIKLLLGYFT